MFDYQTFVPFVLCVFGVIKILRILSTGFSWNSGMPRNYPGFLG
jgi:hypothetical protein